MIKKTAESSQPLFYKKIAPLNKEVHSGLYIKDIENYFFAKESNSVYIAAIEFVLAAREYPVVFARSTAKAVFPVALLGLDEKQNLFVDEKGQWTADYIPAYIRRYPFILAVPDDKLSTTFTVCIDESFPGFNTAKEGNALFDEQGEQLAFLKQAVDFIKDYQTHVRLTTLFCENLSKLDLLEPMRADIQMASGTKYALNGFLCVNKEKLKTLKPEQLADLVNSNQMELIFAHLASLSNIKNNLMKRLAYN